MNVLEIKRRIDNAKAIDFGTIFNDSVELFKKVWVQGLVTLLLNMVLAIPVVILIYIPLIFLGFLDLYASSTNDAYSGDYATSGIGPFMIVVMIVLYLFAIAAISTIGVALRAALYRICKLKDLEQMGKEDYFYSFKKPYLVKSIKLGLTIVGLSVAAAMFYLVIFFYLIFGGTDSFVSFPLMLLSFLPLIYIAIPLIYVVVIYAFNPDKSISEIIKLGFSLGKKKWLITFGLLFVSSLLAGIVGLIMCGVGVYVTASFSNLPSYFIYKDVVGFDDEDETRQIEENVTF